MMDALEIIDDNLDEWCQYANDAELAGAASQLARLAMRFAAVQVERAEQASQRPVVSDGSPTRDLPDIPF